jgi:RNA polymerase sigma factor (sigma-70 family)
MAVGRGGIGGERDFPATSWSVILHSRDPGSPEHERHLRRLIELYWKPIYWVIRGTWNKSHDDAKDLTQEFFAASVLGRSLVSDFEPTRGSFRAFLRSALKHFLQNASRDASRLKRGGGLKSISLDGDELAAGSVPGGSQAVTPEELFDLAWHQTVLQQAVAALERRLLDQGRTVDLEVFRRLDLDEGEASYADIGAALSLSVPQVKHALTRARKTFHQVAADILRGYVDGASELAAEMRDIFGTGSTGSS